MASLPRELSGEALESLGVIAALPLSEPSALRMRAVVGGVPAARRRRSVAARSRAVLRVVPAVIVGGDSGAATALRSEGPRRLSVDGDGQ